MPSLSFKEFVFEPMKSSVKKYPARDMVDGLGFCIDKDLTKSRIVAEQAIVR
jgi:hypothetical protein